MTRERWICGVIGAGLGVLIGISFASAMRRAPRQPEPPAREPAIPKAAADRTLGVSVDAFLGLLAKAGYPMRPIALASEPDRQCYSWKNRERVVEAYLTTVGDQVVSAEVFVTDGKQDLNALRAVTAAYPLHRAGNPRIDWIGKAAAESAAADETYASTSTVASPVFQFHWRGDGGAILLITPFPQ